MPASINDFLSSFKHDVARPARFDVQIPVPLKLIRYLKTARQLTFRCETAELPAVTLATTERKIYGPVEKQPYLKTYGETTMVFICSSDMSEKAFFDAWIELINPKTSFDNAYKEDYITTMTVNQYDGTNKVTYAVDFIDAFPISINQLDLDWSNENSHHKLAVTFAYYRWEVSGLAGMASGFVDTAIGAGVDFVTGKINDILGGGDGGKSVYDMKNIAKNFQK